MTVEGRVNAVRVPADVFLNGSQYSYDVASAAFRTVDADSISVTRALNTITVGTPVDDDTRVRTYGVMDFKCYSQQYHHTSMKRAPSRAASPPDE